jgi:hypothetical protein
MKSPTACWRATNTNGRGDERPRHGVRGGGMNGTVFNGLDLAVIIAFASA